MRFRSSNNEVFIREAILDDSEILSSLQWEHLQKYSSLDIPRSAESYRIAIGRSLLKGDRYLVAEDNHEVVGFVEQRKQNPSHVKIGYPYVSLHHPKRKDVQFHLINRTIHRLKEIGVKFISTELSNRQQDAFEMYQSLGFENSRIILQAWEGKMITDLDNDTSEYTIRRVKLKDLDKTYAWISKQLDKMSPIYITRSTYRELLRAPKSVRDGWAIAVLDEQPVAMISSLIDKQAKTVIVFGPYCEDGHEKARTLILNELFLYYKLRGYENVRLLRIRPFSNDHELFTKFNLKKTDEITLLIKYL